MSTQDQLKKFWEKYKEPKTEEEVKAIFIVALKSYIVGEISATMFEDICTDLVYNFAQKNDISITEFELISLIESVTELGYIREKSKKLAELEDELKRYFKMNS